MNYPPLGSISPADRTPDQRRAHEDAMNKMTRFAIAGATAALAKGDKVILTQAFKDPAVIADMGGREFDGFRQNTGSCVGVSEGDIIACTSAVQRLVADQPTRAFIPWWPYPYGRTRFNEGDRGQGEGAIDSVCVQTLIKEGVFGITEATGLPQFDTSDGLSIPASTELKYSDGAAAVNTQFLSLGKQHPLGTAAPIGSTADMASAIINGYGILDGCDNYIGKGQLQSGVSLGTYDGRGGHSTCLSGDTKVSLLDGTEVPIEDLAADKKTVWVYSYDDGRVVPKKAKAFQTRESVPEGLVRVTLDNGESITATLDHKFMLRDGSYREAKDLKTADSLMPLYRKVSDSKRHPGYEMILDPGTEEWELTHRRVHSSVSLKTYRFVNGRLKIGTLPTDARPVIHHVNFDKRDNSPDNLSKMLNKEHWKYHAFVADGVWDRMSPEVSASRKKNMSNWVKGLWKDPEYREMMRGVSKKSARKMWDVILTDPEVHARFVANNSLRRLWADPEWRAKKLIHLRQALSEEARAKLADNNRRKASDPEFLRRLSEGIKKSWADATPEDRLERVRRMCSERQTKEYRSLQSAIQKKRYATYTQEQRNKFREAIRNSWKRRKAGLPPINHKVASVEFLPKKTGPVYCMEVEGTHNFAVSAGVFVHNCYVGVWNHPDLGLLFLYWNQWSGGTYPNDASGKVRCSVWVKEANVAKLFSTGGRGETFAISHLSYFPAQPKVKSWADLIP